MKWTLFLFVILILFLWFKCSGDPEIRRSRYNQASTVSRVEQIETDKGVDESDQVMPVQDASIAQNSGDKSSSGSDSSSFGNEVSVGSGDKFPLKNANVQKSYWDNQKAEEAPENLTKEYEFLNGHNMQPIMEGWYKDKLNTFDGFYIGKWKGHPISMNLNFAREKDEDPITCLRFPFSEVSSVSKRFAQVEGTFYPIHTISNTVFMFVKDNETLEEKILQLDFSDGSSTLRAGFIKGGSGIDEIEKVKPHSLEEQDCQKDYVRDPEES